MSATTGGTTRAAMSWNDQVIADFHEGKQRITGTFDRSNLLLHTTGARSGQPRTSPVACFSDGDRLLVVTSAAGADRHPAWYHNLLAEPEVGVEIWKDDQLDSFTARAAPAPDDERERLFAKIVSIAPGFGDYHTKTDRTIPVVVLARLSLPTPLAGPAPLRASRRGRRARR